MDTTVDPNFRQRAYELVRQIPKGKVMTYGQIAALCGNARAARIVGGIAHFGNPDLPWQRVVNKSGGLASGYPGGRAAHKAHLEAEGIEVDKNFRVDINSLLWSPSHDSQLTPPLVVIVGETTSGKSALALELAERFDGEIICADSRTIYRGMDIGTAKPSKKDQKAVIHHLLDIVDPDEGFNVREFKQLALNAIQSITAKGNLPILVGGTGLYIDAVLFDYQFSPPGARRNLYNLRHLKYQELTAYQKPIRANSLLIGLGQPKDQLQAHVKERIEAMFHNGLIDEVDTLIQRYGWDAPGLNTIGYQELRPLFENEQTLAEAKQHIERNTILYAKRQRTWFKRNNSIHWLKNPREAVDLVTTFLNKKQ